MPNHPPSRMSDSVASQPPEVMRTAEDTQEREWVLWVRAARGGDPEAFARLVRRFQRQAAAVAYRFVGNSEDAADVAQEAFVRAYRSLEQLEDDRRFKSWLMRIVTNLSLNFRRRRKNEATSSLEEGLEPEEAERRTGRSRSERSDDRLAASELRQRIDEAMGMLPEKQRTALILFSIEKLPQKDVAEIMGCSVELVKWNVFQARRKMMELLGDLGIS